MCTVREGLAPDSGLIGMDEATAPGVAREPQTSFNRTVIVDDGTTAFDEPPPLLHADPDVYVAENADEPVYYVDGSYWRESDDEWSRADYWDTPWMVVSLWDVPDAIVHRHHDSFRHFHGDARTHRWREPRDHASSDLDRFHSGTHQASTARDAASDVGPWPHAPVQTLSEPGLRTGDPTRAQPQPDRELTHPPREVAPLPPRRVIHATPPAEAPSPPMALPPPEHPRPQEPVPASRPLPAPQPLPGPPAHPPAPPPTPPAPPPPPPPAPVPPSVAPIPPRVIPPPAQHPPAVAPAQRPHRREVE